MIKNQQASVGDVLFKNEYYAVVINEAIITEDYKGLIYSLVNKNTKMVEYEDHFLPSIISVAKNAERGLVDLFKPEVAEPDLTRIQ